MTWFQDPNSFLSKPNRVLIAQLWVTSVAGTGLVLVLQTIGQDWSNYAWGDIDWRFTANRALRYALICWFAAHLSVAYVLNEMLRDGRTRSLAYDVAQSVAGFAAFFSLGFVTQDLNSGSDFPRSDFSIAFVGIALIGALAAMHNWPELSLAQLARACAAIIACIAAWLVQFSDASENLRWFYVTVGVVLCWAILIGYWFVRRVITPTSSSSIKPLTENDVKVLLDQRCPKQSEADKQAFAKRIKDLVLAELKSSSITKAEAEQLIQSALNDFGKNPK